jgi:hypothetical protein
MRAGKKRSLPAPNPRLVNWALLLGVGRSSLLPIIRWPIKLLVLRKKSLTLEGARISSLNNETLRLDFSDSRYWTRGLLGGFLLVVFLIFFYNFLL